MTSTLASENLTPCRHGIPPLAGHDLTTLLRQLPAWTHLTVDGTPQLQRSFSFRNFAEALAFANAVGALAEAADHHPAITVEWGKVTVHWWTHVIGGLHRNDFVLAARTDQILQ